MSKFIKGTIFTMGGKEYEVLTAGTDDPASSLVYAPLHEDDSSDPLSIRLWKAEAKLARGDIMINGYEENPTIKDSFYPPVIDPLEQIAELKKRIRAIEERRVLLLKVNDPLNQILIQDNIVRPNKAFDIWAYTSASPQNINKRNIQYIKIRGLVLALSTSSNKIEHFLFNIADQLQPCCRISGDTLSSVGEIKIDLSSELKTIQGSKTSILTSELGGKIELGIELRLNCKFATGLSIISSNILHAAYTREIKAPGLKINKLSFPEIGEHMIVIEGVWLDIYTEGFDK